MRSFFTSSSNLIMNDSKINVGLKKLPIHLQSSQNRILIKGGKVVNDDRMFSADVYIEDGIIKQVGQQLTIPGGVRIIDATGNLVIPGGIDTHTHFQMLFMGTVSSDDFYTGTKAALAGGTTTIIDFVCAKRSESLLKNYEQYREWADPKVCCDYALHVIVPHYDDVVAREMETLVKEKGINSFKMFLAYPDVFLLEDNEFFNVMKRCRELGALSLVHAENGKLIRILQDELYNSGVTGPEGHLYSRPEAAEIEATSRAITLAEAAMCPLYIVHVMSATAARAISTARHRGSIVFGEATAAALGADGSHYQHSCWRHAAGYVMSPPLRPEPNNGKELMHCLATGEIECTGSDHCVTKTEQKALGKDDFRKIPNGVNGVEDRMSVIWEKGVVSGILDPCRFVAVTSTNAAKVFNLYPRKGRIDVGSDADLVIWNPEETRTISADTHHQNVDFNIFEGMQCHGVPVTVLTGGRVVVEDSEVRVTQGAGRYLPSPPFSPYVYTRLKQMQAQREMKPVGRTPYTGPVSADFGYTDKLASLQLANRQQDGNDAAKPAPRHWSPTRGGGRNMQESSFALSGAQIDDERQLRTTIRTKQPPGGASTSLW